MGPFPPRIFCISTPFFSFLKGLSRRIGAGEDAYGKSARVLLSGCASGICLRCFVCAQLSRKLLPGSSLAAHSKLRAVLGQVDAARMRETFDLIARARLEIGEK
jgi:hypothetical protein